MKIIRSIKTMKQIVKQLKKEQMTIGFTPTMGFFHEGHLTLMEEAKKENDISITSVFVNPLQFGPNEDFATYPRDEERDTRLAEQNGVNYLFIPDVKEMYPREMMIRMTINDRVDVLCGKSRPGHFDGVITVLTKLFHIVQPDKVYFGMKDAQQIAVVDALLDDLNFPIELKGIPTVREKNGLAKSSRNVYLSEIETEQATWIYKALLRGQKLIQDGERNPVVIEKDVKQLIEQKTDATVEYVSILTYPDLKPVLTIDQKIILAVAVVFSHARLIDNLIIDENGHVPSFHNKND